MFEGGTSEEEMMRADVIAAEVQTNFITYSNSIMVFVAWEHLIFLNVRLLTYFVLSIKGCNF